MRMKKNRRRNRHEVGQDGNLAGIREDTQLGGLNLRRSLRKKIDRRRIPESVRNNRAIANVRQPFFQRLFFLATSVPFLLRRKKNLEYLRVARVRWSLIRRKSGIKSSLIVNNVTFDGLNNLFSALTQTRNLGDS